MPQFVDPEGWERASQTISSTPDASRGTTPWNWVRTKPVSRLSPAASMRRRCHGMAQTTVGVASHCRESQPPRARHGADWDVQRCGDTEPATPHAQNHASCQLPIGKTKTACWQPMDSPPRACNNVPTPFGADSCALKPDCADTSKDRRRFRYPTPVEANNARASSTRDGMACGCEPPFYRAVAALRACVSLKYTDTMRPGRWPRGR
jgi:hypothetical protein